MIVQQIKKYYLFALLVLVVFISALSEPTIFSIGFYNLIPIRLLLPLFVLLYFGLNYKKLNFKPLLKDTIFRILVIFLAIKILSGIVTQDYVNYLQLLGFWSMLISFYCILFLENKRLKLLTKYFSLFYLILLGVLNSWSLFKYWYFITYPKVQFLGFMQHYKVSNIVADENHYAYFLTIMFFVVLPLIFKLKKWYLWVGVILMQLITTIMISGTQSRAGVISFAAGYALFLIFYLFKVKLALNKASFKLLLLTLVSTGGIIFGADFFNTFTPTYDFQGYTKPNNVLTENNVPSTNTSKDYLFHVEEEPSKNDILFENLLESGLPSFLNEASFKAHLVLIYSAFRMGLQNPILGVGVGSFNEYLRSTPLIKLYAKYDPRSASSVIFPPHSMFGEAVAETGVTGLIIYLSLLFVIGKKYFYSLFKAKNIGLAYSFVSILVAFILFSTFYNLNEEWVWLPLFTGIFLANDLS